MRRLLAVSVSCATLIAALAAMPGTADAQHARQRPRAHVVHYTAPPLTVHGRSFLDPGNVVPVGSTTNYVNDSTIFNRTPDQINQRSKFGNEALPGPFDLMGAGRPQPIFEFSTGGY